MCPECVGQANTHHTQRINGLLNDDTDLKEGECRKFVLLTQRDCETNRNRILGIH